MLHLAEHTNEQWFERIEPELETILIDHAHLERRAASTAMSMLFRYTPRKKLQTILCEIITEEVDHYQRMLDILERRNIEFRKLQPAPYASKMVKHIRSHDPEALLDKLLVSALIEARSCERFQILAENVKDEELRVFYEELYICEAKHYTTYTDIAREYFDPQEVLTRLDELAAAELEALKASADMARLHSY